LGVLTIFQFVPAIAALARRSHPDRPRAALGGLRAGVPPGLFTTFETPARQAFVSELVPRQDVQSAIAMNSTVFNAARIVAPAIGGVIIRRLGRGLGLWRQRGQLRRRHRDTRHVG
jgi:MFS family permease